MKRSFMILGLGALCANGVVSAAPTREEVNAYRKNRASQQTGGPTREAVDASRNRRNQAAQGFSVTITNNSNDTVYLTGFYSDRTSRVPYTWNIAVFANEKNRVISFPEQYGDGRAEVLQKVIIGIGQNEWKTVKDGDSVTVEQKDVDQFKSGKSK